MKIFFITILFSLIMLSTILASDTVTNIRDIKATDYVPPPCPDYSLCDIKFQNTFSMWKEAIRKIKNGANKITTLQESLTKYGLPIPIWTKNDAYKNNPIIAWESKCKEHRTAKEKIYKGTIFTKIISLQSPNIIFLKSFFIENGKIKSQLLPAQETPQLLTNKGAIFLIEEDGVYFHIEIANSGELSVVTQTIKVSDSEDIKCPDKLKAVFLKEYKNSIFQNFYCKKVYTANPSNYKIVIFPRSCY